MTELIGKLPKIVRDWIEPNLRQHWESRQPMVWLLSLAAGLVVALAAIVFREMIGAVQFLWAGTMSERLADRLAGLPWYYVFIGPVIGGLAVGFCIDRLLTGRRTFAVADVIEVRTTGKNRIEFRQAIASALITALSLGAGGSAGREGPVVHLGAAFSNGIARHFALPNWGKRTLLGCGVAAAVSASFNAPIAGVLFAHEVILGHYAMRAFVPIVISSVTATIFSRLWFGDVAAFAIPAYQITSFWEFPAFALLGVTCGLVAVLFQFALIGCDYFSRDLRIPLILRPALGGVLIGIIALGFPQVLGVGYEATDQALKSQLPLALMLCLLVAKTIATAITLASRFGGGVFSPSLYLGAMAGGAFGLIAAGFFPDMASSQGLYAILGMGGVAAAVLGAPVSTTVMVFELTGGYALSIGLLLTVSISNGIAQALHGHSFFHWQLEMRGIFVNEGPQQTLLRQRRVRDFMSPLGEDDGDPVMDPDRGDAFLKPSWTLEHALRTFDQGGHARLPVVDEKDENRIIGWAYLTHGLRYFNSALVEATAEEHHH
ncbi:MAG: chloride channel protein [Nitratireductor sp.]|nr:chloride channel protein [Nitratireductor sp.]